MDIFEGKLPILKICATQPRSVLTGDCANVEALAQVLGKAGCFTEQDKQKFIKFGQAFHNGAILDLWHQFLSRSMPTDKQEQAVQYADQILRLQNPDRNQFKDSNFKPPIEQFCGIDLAYNVLAYSERQINTMLALSGQNKLNPIFHPYLMGTKTPFLETDENQIRLNQRLLSQETEWNEGVKKTITYWWNETPAGIQYRLRYGSLQKDLGQALLANRHRVLGVVASHDDKVSSRHPYHHRPSGRNGR